MKVAQNTLDVEFEQANNVQTRLIQENYSSSVTLN